jgi:hypothetical protein
LAKWGIPAFLPLFCPIAIIVVGKRAGLTALSAKMAAEGHTVVRFENCRPSAAEAGLKAKSLPQR